MLFKDVYTFGQVQLVLNHQLKPSVKIDDEALFTILSRGFLMAYPAYRNEHGDVLRTIPNDLQPINQDEILTIANFLYKNGFDDVYRRYWLFKANDLADFIERMRKKQHGVKTIQNQKPEPSKGSPESLQEWIKYIITVEKGLSLVDRMPDGLQAELIRESMKYGYKDASAVKRAWSRLGLNPIRETVKMQKPPKAP